MAEQTKKVNLELEIDTSTVDSSKTNIKALLTLQKQLIVGEYFLEYSSQHTSSYCIKWSFGTWS